jgi:hypothetical protein
LVCKCGSCIEGNKKGGPKRLAFLGSSPLHTMAGEKTLSHEGLVFLEFIQRIDFHDLHAVVFHFFQGRLGGFRLDAPA